MAAPHGIEGAVEPAADDDQVAGAVELAAGTPDRGGPTRLEVDGVERLSLQRVERSVFVEGQGVELTEEIAGEGSDVLRVFPTTSDSAVR